MGGYSIKGKTVFIPANHLSHNLNSFFFPHTGINIVHHLLTRDTEVSPIYEISPQTVYNSILYGLSVVFRLPWLEGSVDAGTAHLLPLPLPSGRFRWPIERI